MTEEERQELQKQVPKLRKMAISNLEESRARELKLVNVLSHIKKQTALETGGIGRCVYLEAKAILDELYPLKKVNDNV